MKLFIRDGLITIVLALVAFMIVQNTAQSFIVLSASMEPQLIVGERVLIDKVSYHFGGPHRGDVALFRAPPDMEGIPYIKRVIGLPGDIVEIKEGSVYINGTALPEPYLISRPAYYMSRCIVPEGQYFVLGDNRNVSSDSHVWGTVPVDNFIGKAALELWPPSEWGTPNYPAD